MVVRRWANVVVDASALNWIPLMVIDRSMCTDYYVDYMCVDIVNGSASCNCWSRWTDRTYVDIIVIQSELSNVSHISLCCECFDT